jgi:hypothetical protein
MPTEVKITELPAASALDTDDLLAVVEDGTTVKATVAQVVALASGGSAATTTSAGIVELATDAETITGTDTTRAVTPSNITALQADATFLEKVSDQVGTMVTGNTETGIAVTYQDSDNTLDLVVDTASATQQGIVELATDAETETGTDTARATTPANVASAYIKKTSVAAKGDLIGATANDTPAIVTAGTDGTLLRSDSNAALGVRWAFDLIRTRSTAWHFNPVLATPVGTAWPIINRAYYAPWFIPGRNLVTAVGYNCSVGGTAGNVVRLGIYTDNGSFGPGTILDQATVVGDANAYRTWTPGAAVAVTDWFWVVACPQGASTPGSTFLSNYSAFGLAASPPPETGAAWAGTYVSNVARYSAESGAFTNNPTLTVETSPRSPFLALRL